LQTNFPRLKNNNFQSYGFGKNKLSLVGDINFIAALAISVQEDCDPSTDVAADDAADDAAADTAADADAAAFDAAFDTDDAAAAAMSAGDVGAASVAVDAFGFGGVGGGGGLGNKTCDLSIFVRNNLFGA
jgi:hypothetical protein